MNRKCDFWEQVFGVAQLDGQLIVCSIVNKFDGPHIAEILVRQAAYNTCKLHNILLSELYWDNKELSWRPRKNCDVDNILSFTVIEHSDEEVIRVCEKQTTVPILFTEPYMKFFYSFGTNQHKFVILCPHTVIDGMSLLVFINDFMKQLALVHEGLKQDVLSRPSHYLTDSEIISLLVGDAEKPKPVENDDILPIPFDTLEMISENDCTHQFIIESLEDSQAIQNLLAKCKQEGVTLHAAIVAALTVNNSWIQNCELDSFTARIASPVSFRHKIAKSHEQGSIIANSMGNMHVFSYDLIHVEKRETLDKDLFWRSARDYRKSLQTSLDTNSYIFNLNNLEYNTVTMYVSNIGSVDAMLSGAYGPFTVQSIPFFINFSNPAPFIGVHTQRGKMHISVSYLQPLYTENKMRQMVKDCISTLVNVIN